MAFRSPSQPTTSPRDFADLWDKSIGLYEQDTGIKLLASPIANAFPSRPESANAVMDQIVKQNEVFEAFHKSGKKVLVVLRPVVDIIILAKTYVEGAASAIPGGQIILGAIGVLLEATKGVSRLYDAVASLFRKVKDYLTRVAIHFRVSTPLSEPLLDILANTMVQVFHLFALATKYCNSVVGSDSCMKRCARVVFRRTKDYFRVLVHKTGAQGILDNLEELTERERLLLAADTNATIREVKRDVSFICAETAISALRSWLRPPQPRPADYDKKRKHGSCQWFINDERFQQWKTSKGGVYWVYGNAGAGKSVLCSAVLDTLSMDKAQLLAYFYVDYSNIQQREGWDGLVSSLIFQLGTGSSEACYKYLVEKRGGRVSRDSLTSDQLLDMFVDLLLIPGPTVVVIDALDEFPQDMRQDHLFPFLKRLHSNLETGNVELRLFITSRPESDIQHFMTEFPSFVTHQLDLDSAQQHRGELAEYVAVQLAASRVNLRQSAKKDAQAILVEKANGMFLWVDLQLRRLEGLVDEKDVEDTLQKLPIGLEATYQRILEIPSSSDASIKRARRVLEGVMSAKRLLSLVEVLEIYSVDPESAADMRSSIAEQSDETEDKDPESVILRGCPGLLDIVSLDEGEKVVQFIHLSVQEYLTSPKLLRANPPACEYGIDAKSANLTLARFSLRALAPESTFAVLRPYADAYWDQHVSPSNEGALSTLLGQFLHIGSASFTRWADARFGRSDEYSAFRYAAKLGLCQRVGIMLKDPKVPPSTFVNTCDEYGHAALYLAVGEGHTDMCLLLINSGALVDQKSYNMKGDFPLHRAAWDGHLDIIRLLLEHSQDRVALCDARENGRAGQGMQTALHKAAEAGHVEICRLLIDNGARIDAFDSQYTTPLICALRSRRPNIVRVMLEHRAKDKPQPEIFDERLQWEFRSRADAEKTSAARSGPWSTLMTDFATQFEVSSNESDTEPSKSVPSA
ncbi:unnamed protein product [Peniophora sp. CBMAI 1063]|nr:unnamed protein product [Peniophora sp. CBMAI 1063]